VCRVQIVGPACHLEATSRLSFPDKKISPWSRKNFQKAQFGFGQQSVKSWIGGTLRWCGSQFRINFIKISLIGGGQMKFVLKLLVLLFTCVFLSQAFALAADKGSFSTTPRTNKGKKWRIGYIEVGPYESYQKVLKATVAGLMELGWIEEAEIPDPDDPKDTSKLWAWLVSSIKSRYIQFVADAYWNAKWKDELRKKNKEKVIHRLNKRKDIDLMLALGTKAGQDMANNRHSVPTVVGSTTNPLTANIIKSVEDSGYDHIHAMIDPERHERQVRLFYDLIGFKLLGIAYRDSETGRSTSGIPAVEKVAKELGFEIIACDLLTVIPGSNENERKEEKAALCYEKLAPKVDAIYITRYAGGVTLKNMPRLLAPINKLKIPSFSQAGADEVKHGVLFSIATAKFIDQGRFYAKTIAKIFNGARPRDIGQVFKIPPKIVINLKTAKIIGYDPPIDLLGSTDEIFEEIAVAE
jgi:ABC-type uncharacterized transport system substrate-binding protein